MAPSLRQKAGWGLADVAVAWGFVLSLYVALLCVLYDNVPSVNVTSTAGLFALASMTNGACQQIP